MKLYNFNFLCLFSMSVTFTRNEVEVIPRSGLPRLKPGRTVKTRPEHEVGKLKKQPTDKAIRKLWNDLEEYLIVSPIGVIDAVEVSAEFSALDLSVGDTAEFKVKGKKTTLEGKVTKIDSTTKTVTLKTNIGFIVVPFNSLLISAEYTLYVNCSCEMQFTLTEQEVESADGSGGDEGDVEPTDKVLFSMREEFKEYLSSNSNGWEVAGEVYITAECDDLY